MGNPEVALDEHAGALRIHDLRHTAASLAVAVGANVKVQGADLRKRVVGPVGFEPTTYGLKVRCSTS